MTCEWAVNRFAFLDAQTSSGRTHWHTRCWNDAERQRQQYFKEMDDLEGFTPCNAPPDGSRLALPDELGPKPEWSEETEDDMATASQRTPREVVDFPPHVPVSVALKYGQGKTISSQHGERMMYSLVDGRVMFLDLETAAQIEKLAINVRESFTVKGAFEQRHGLSFAPVVERLNREWQEKCG